MLENRQINKKESYKNRFLYTHNISPYKIVLVHVKKSIFVGFFLLLINNLYSYQIDKPKIGCKQSFSNLHKTNFALKSKQQSKDQFFEPIFIVFPPKVAHYN